MAHIGQHFLAQECGERGGALGRARRAEPTTLARESHQELGPASAAPHAGEAVFEDAAVEVGGDCLVDAAPPEAVAPLEALALSSVTSSLPIILTGVHPAFPEGHYSRLCEREE